MDNYRKSAIVLRSVFLLLVLMIAGALAEPMSLKYNTNLSAGTTIALPLYGTVDVTVNWGDGNIETTTATGNLSHTYASEGSYTVTIDGSLTAFGNSSVSGIDKLDTVTSFGDIGITSLENAFSGAVNLTAVPATLPAGVTNLSGTFSGASSFNQSINSWNTSSVTNMSGTFNSASSFNQPLNNWDVSNVENMSMMFFNEAAFNQPLDSWNTSSVKNMSMMFYLAISFNQLLGSWDISSVDDMSFMFYSATLSSVNYDATLNGWAAQTVKPSINFDGGNSRYTLAGKVGRDILTGSPNGWTITDGDEITSTSMILFFSTQLSTGRSIGLYLSGTVDVTINWGDGNSEATTTAGLIRHEYLNEGSYTVTIDGSLTGFANGAYNQEEANKIVEVISFGDIGITSLNSAFVLCKNLSAVPSELPAGVTDLSSAFWGATNFNDDISSWDVSNVVNMAHMFNDATSFNQPLNSWNVSKVTDMSYMFFGATSFNQPLDSWITSEVVNMYSIFSLASSFNQPLNSWNTSKVTNMEKAFSNAISYKQPLNGWDISEVTNITNMLDGVTLSPVNYDATLNAWAAQTVNSSLSFNGGNSKYTTTGKSGRDILTETYGWIITDGGLITSPTVITEAASSITGTTAMANGNITDLGSFNVTEYGIYYSTTAGFADGTGTKISTTGNLSSVGLFSEDITGLDIHTTYYVKAFATNSNGAHNSYGNEISFTTLNNIPASKDTAITLNEDSTYIFTNGEFSFTDADNVDTLVKIQIITLETAGSLKLDNIDVALNQEIAVADISKLAFTPVADANGLNYDSFGFKVSDGYDYSTEAYTVTFDVAAVNDAPVISSSATLTATEDVAWDYIIVVTDVDNDDATITYSISGEPTGMTITDNVISWTPVNGQLSSGEVTVQVSDTNVSVEQKFTVTVTAVNDTPIVVGAVIDTTIMIGEEFSFTLPSDWFEDEDQDDILTLTVTGLPAGILFDGISVISGTPTATGTNTVIVTATDIDGLSAIDSFIIDVDMQTAIDFIDNSNSENDNIAIIPNPVSIDANEVSIFIPGRFSGGGTIAIYDFLGELLDYQSVNIHGASTYRWDLRNSSGQEVGSGTYTALITITDNSGKTQTAKMMIGVKQ